MGEILVVICFALFFVINIMPEIIFFGIMANMVQNTVVETVLSPDGTYEAYVMSHDAGATGGGTTVRVKKIKKWGIFQNNKEERLQMGEWGEEYDLVWIDDDTLEVNGEKIYEMGDIW